MNGFFISFEGGEGAGKSTQINLLVEALNSKGFEVEFGAEPGKTEIGLECRRLLKDTNLNPNPISELLLFEVARSEHVEKDIIPKLEKGLIYISDRFTDSSIVYQGIVRGLGVNKVKELNDLVTNNLQPDLTFVLDVDSKQGLSNSVEVDRLELEGNDFHKKVNESFRNLKDLFPERNIILVPRMSIEEVHKFVFEKTLKFLNVNK